MTSNPPESNTVNGSDSVDPPKKVQRRRQIISCAECRRLKLKCDRGNPCSSCVRRGLQSLCPDGSVSGSWRGNRVILATTEDLHQRSEVLSNRIKELEDALRTLQSSIAEEPHPLLTPDLLLLKLPPGVRTHIPEVSEAPKEEDIAEVFGTLQISRDGAGVFFGSTAASEFLIPENESTNSASGVMELPTELLVLTTQFPFYNIEDANGYLKSRIRELLPPLKVAWGLCTLYFERFAWLYSGIEKSEFVNDVLTPVYSQGGSQPVTGAQLALLYMIMAIGVQVDPSIQAYHPTAEQYHKLGRAALTLENVLADPSFIALCAVYKLCLYLQLSDRKGAVMECTVLQGVMVKMAQGMGLHRDPTRFKLSEIETQRRRRLFWEVYISDMWIAFATGRPPSIPHAQVDTKSPVYPEDNNRTDGYHHAKNRFCLHYLSKFAEKAFPVAQKPSYATILQLDSELRSNTIYPERYLVPGLESGAPLDKEPPSFQLTMQRHSMYVVREVLFLYLHRGYFAHALQAVPKNPLKSKYGPSVLAAYRSACSMMVGIRHCFALEKEGSLRTYFFWSHAASASIIFSALVTLWPGSPLSASATLELDQACALFQEASVNHRVARFLPTIQKLRARAHRTLYEYNSGTLAGVNISELQEVSQMTGGTRVICKVSRQAIYSPTMDRNAASKAPGEQATGPVTEQNHCNVTSSDKGPTEIGSQDRGPGVSHRNAQDGLVPPVFVGAHSSLADFYAGLYDPNTYSDITLNLLGPLTNYSGNSNGSNNSDAPLSTQAYQHQQEPSQPEDNSPQPIMQNLVNINQFDQINPAYSQWARQGTQSIAPSVVYAPAAQPVQTYVDMTEPDIASAYPDWLNVSSQNAPETAESGEGSPDMDWATLVEQLGVNL